MFLKRNLTRRWAVDGLKEILHNSWTMNNQTGLPDYIKNNQIKVLCDNRFARIYLAGFESCNSPKYVHYNGLNLGVVLKGFKDCSGGNKAIKSYHIPIFWSKCSNFSKGGLWRKWSNFCSFLKRKFWYL